MPESTSKNWDRWTDEQRDRTHRDREETNRQKINSKVAKFLRKRCPKCHKKVGGDLQQHMSTFHPIKIRLRQNKPISRSRKSSQVLKVKLVRKGNKVIEKTMATCISLAKELKSRPEYVLNFARREGEQIQSISSPLPPKVVSKLRTKFGL